MAYFWQKSKEKAVDPEKEQAVQNYVQRAIVDLNDRRDESAVKNCDKAIALGLRDARIYGLRATALQGLGWDLDAADDFTVALVFDETDCNVYFQRAMSRVAFGDKDGAIRDINTAILMSTLPQNKKYDDWRREGGNAGLLVMYHLHLNSTVGTSDFILSKNREAAFARGRRTMDNGST